MTWHAMYAYPPPVFLYSVWVECSRLCIARHVYNIEAIAINESVAAAALSLDAFGATAPRISCSRSRFCSLHLWPATAVLAVRASLPQTYSRMRVSSSSGDLVVVGSLSGTNSSRALCKQLVDTVEKKLVAVIHPEKQQPDLVAQQGVILIKRVI